MSAVQALHIDDLVKRYPTGTEALRGFPGISDTSVALSLGFLAVATTALFVLNLRLFRRGYRLRA